MLAKFATLARGLRPGWTGAGFLALVSGALTMRLVELSGRTMHYDEAIHLQAAWRLSEGHDYVHSAWMHGPLQIELTAMIFWIFGDTDFTSRLGYVLFGAALVGLPYFLRDHIGRAGALFTGLLLALSPALLYFSRFGRNDIIMVFLVSALLVVMWRFFHEGHSRYLFLASALLAFMLATKETAYMVILIFGGISFLLALPLLVPMVLRRERFSQLTGPAGFLLLLITLTLPQWMAFFSIFQDALGLVLATREGGEGGLVGAPLWAAPNVIIPVFAASWWFHTLAAALPLITMGLWSTRHRVSSLPIRSVRRYAPRIGVPVAVTAATIIVLVSPLGDRAAATIAELSIAGVLAVSALAVLIISRHPWRQSFLLFLVPPFLTVAYLTAFTGFADVDLVVHWILPSAVSLNAGPGEVPLNYLVAGGLLTGGLVASIFLGVIFLGGRWLAMAGIFYVIWVTLYTTFYTNLAGIFSGTWQGVGYWIAQQDVARGNQPWYYYFVQLSVYEFLPVVFGVAGAVYFLKKGNLLGVVIAGWAAVNTLIYTITSEKMPWLLVNVTLPFIFLAGIYLGELFDRVSWRNVVAGGTWAILILTPLAGAGGLYLLITFLDQGKAFGLAHWWFLASIGVVALALAYLTRLATPRQGLAMAGLGFAALLLALSTWASVRAAYTFDDSNVEILVYAQGGADLKDTFNDLNDRVFYQNPQNPQNAAAGASGPDTKVVVDYDVWYPFQWYVRHPHQDGELSFACFKGKSEDGKTDDCKRVSDAPEASARVLTMGHGDRDKRFLDQFQQSEPLQNLLWFPESYRRPDENRQAEGSFWGFRGVPGKEQFSKDLGFFRDSALSRETWSNVLDYWMFRKLERDWYDAKYYSYLP